MRPMCLWKGKTLTSLKWGQWGCQGVENVSTEGFDHRGDQAGPRKPQRPLRGTQVVLLGALLQPQCTAT